MLRDAYTANKIDDLAESPGSESFYSVNVYINLFFNGQICANPF